MYHCSMVIPPAEMTLLQCIYVQNAAEKVLDTAASLRKHSQVDCAASCQHGGCQELRSSNNNASETNRRMQDKNINI